MIKLFATFKIISCAGIKHVIWECTCSLNCTCGTAFVRMPNFLSLYAVECIVGYTVKY